MNGNDLLQWIETVIDGLPDFLETMRDRNTPGRYKYSLTGDIASSSQWGLGNTVFAVKTYYMLNLISNINEIETTAFIKSFGKRDGEISDPIVQRRSRRTRYYAALRSGDWSNITGKRTRKAETRQAFAALQALGSKPDEPYSRIPTSENQIKRYIHSLDWNQPWSAASHFSHLIFFMKVNKKFDRRDNSEIDLIDLAFTEVNKYKQDDGSWYKNSTSKAQKVNGAMKMITAYMVAEKDDLANRQKLIDLCLSLTTDEDACNNFNLVLVLYFCSRNLDYREGEIKVFCLDRLRVYRDYYWPEHGGFSFFRKHANNFYYGAKVSEGLQEPDIHGTHLFVWGLALITKILNEKSSINLTPPIT